MREAEGPQSMEAQKQIIGAKLEGSGFVLTIETEESVGYRSGMKSEAQRTVYVDLGRWTVEYELTEKGALSRHRLEHFATIEQLIERLPCSAHSFDLKFQDPNPDTVTFQTTGDPWDLTNYHARPTGEKPQRSIRLRIAV
jgi:hypothetical protein